MILIIKHVSIEGPGVIAEFLENTTWKVKIIELGKGDKLPPDLSELEAVIVLGGPMNVYEEDEYPFLRDEDVFLKKAIREEIPILGICLGAQLLAKACGAKVKRAEVEEIGWCKVSLTKDGREDSVFYSTANELDVFQWHEDTFEVPTGGTLLATSDDCQNQAFRFGKNAYGLQFHIEVTPNMVESWINGYLDSENPSEIIANEKMIIDAYRKKEHFEEQAKKILLSFSRLIAEK